MINKTHLLKTKEIFKYDWQLIIAIILLCSIGLAFLASSLNNDPVKYWPELLKQFFVGIGFGSIITVILAKTDYHILTKHSKILITITFILLGFLAFFAILILPKTTVTEKYNTIQSFSWLPIRPHIANGAVRWIDLPLGLPNVQPSEIAKITLLIYFASSLSKVQRNGFDWQNLKRPFWTFGIITFLVLIQPDLGTVIMVFTIIFSSMLVANVPKQILTKVTLVCLIIAFIAIISTPYRRQRFLIYADFFKVFTKDDPKDDTKEDKIDKQQVENIQWAMRNGGWFGKGYGNSELKQAKMIYEASTDSIIAVIGEEIGFVGTISFLCLYLWLFWRGMKIASEAKDLEGQMIATGISIWIFTQVFLNVCGMTGLIPMKGLPLPFVSQGGTAIVMNLVGIGILLNISSQRKAGFNQRSNL